MFLKSLYRQKWIDYVEENIPERTPKIEIGMEKNFLISTGFFRDSDIESYTRLIGSYVMGGQYTICNAVIDLLYRIETK